MRPKAAELLDREAGVQDESREPDRGTRGPPPRGAIVRLGGLGRGMMTASVGASKPGLTRIGGARARRSAHDSAMATPRESRRGGMSWQDIKDEGAEVLAPWPQSAQELGEWPQAVLRAILADFDRAEQFQASLNAASMSTSYSGFD